MHGRWVHRRGPGRRWQEPLVPGGPVPWNYVQAPTGRMVSSSQPITVLHLLAPVSCSALLVTTGCESQGHWCWPLLQPSPPLQSRTPAAHPASRSQALRQLQSCPEQQSLNHHALSPVFSQHPGLPRLWGYPALWSASRCPSTLLSPSAASSSMMVP